MLHRFSRPRRRIFARLGATTALAGLTLSLLAVSPAAASDNPPAAPSALATFAAARAVTTYLTAVSTGTLPPTSQSVALADAQVVAQFLSSASDVPTAPPGTIEVLRRDAEDVRAYLSGDIYTGAADQGDEMHRLAVAAQSASSSADKVALLTALREASERLVDSVRVFVKPEPYLPDPVKAAEQADALVAYLSGTVGGEPSAVMGEVSAIAQSIVDNPAARQALTDLDTVLLYLGSQVTPLTDQVPPTSEQAMSAAESAAASIDQLYGIVDDTSPSVEVGVPQVTADVGPPVAVPGADPGLWLDPATAQTLDGLSSSGSGATGGSPCYSQEGTCAPPLRNPATNPVQHNPTLYLIFWGSGWDGHTAERQAVTSFANGLSGSAFQAVLDQYFDSTGHVGRSVTVDTWYDPASPAQDDGTNLPLLKEAKNARVAKGWRAGVNSQFLIFPEPDSLWGAANECGRHGQGAYGTTTYIFGVVNFPTGLRASCRAGGTVTSGLTFFAAHEYAEAVTDPLIATRPAWVDGTPQEIADLCTNDPNFGSVGGQVVTALWSNAANACVNVFDRGNSYEVVSTTDPVGAPYARGHAYRGGQITVRNTGTTAWYTGGTHALHLMTHSGACSHGWDQSTWDKTSTWWTCSRVKFPTSTTIAPGATLTFTVPLRPDGSLNENSFFSQEFTLIVETVAVVSARTGVYPAVGGMIAAHKAAAVEPATQSFPGVGRVVVATAGGADPVVDVPFDIQGDAPWWSSEVVDLATLPLGTRSPWAAGNWPSANTTGACAGCRAGRVTGARDTAHQPGTPYTFPVTLHIPASTRAGAYSIDLEPVADIPIVGGGIGIKKMAAVQHLTLVVVAPKPLAHDVTGLGMSGAMPDTSAQSGDASSTQWGRWWACAAAGGADTLGTTITACTATVVHADGTFGASKTVTSGAESLGPVAVAVGTGISLSAADDMLRVCWTAFARYPDLSVATRSGCD